MSSLLSHAFTGLENIFSYFLRKSRRTLIEELQKSQNLDFLKKNLKDMRNESLKGGIQEKQIL